jgi:hypothetical protein
MLDGDAIDTKELSELTGGVPLKTQKDTVRPLSDAMLLTLLIDASQQMNRFRA